MCTKCKEEKSLEEFSKNKSAKDGLKYQCKGCESSRHKQYYEDNPDYNKAASKKWREDNPDYNKSASKKWREDNPDKRAANNANYRAKKRNQTPPDADRNLMLVFYTEAQRLTEETGIKYEVDHYIPLDLGGLHHQDNLQVITQAENQSKSAKDPKVFYK